MWQLGHRQGPCRGASANRGPEAIRRRRFALASKADDPGLDELHRRRRELATGISGAEKRQRNLYRALEEALALDHALLARVRQLSEEQRRLATEPAAVERELRSGGSGLSAEEVAALLADVPRLLDEAEPDQLRELVRTFVRRVVVHPRDVPCKTDPELHPKQITVEFWPL